MGIPELAKVVSNYSVENPGVLYLAARSESKAKSFGNTERPSLK